MLTKYVAVAALVALSGRAHAQGRNTKFLEVATHGKYKPGFYTLVDGSRHSASLRIWQDLTHNVLQSDQGKAEPINLEASALRGFVMGRDSFLVARRVAIAGRPTELPFGEAAFFKVKLAGSIDVWEHDQLVGGSVQPGGMSGMLTSTGPSHALAWVLRPAVEASPVAVPQNQAEFAKHMAALFVNNPVLCQRIRAGLDGPNDFKRIVYAYLLKKDITQVTYEEATTIFR
jgi:hypothetical protein